MLVRTCRVCGCTDADCTKCIEKTGQACLWVEEDLCSACYEENSSPLTNQDFQKILKQYPKDLIVCMDDSDNGILALHANLSSDGQHIELETNEEDEKSTVGTLLKELERYPDLPVGITDGILIEPTFIDGTIGDADGNWSKKLEDTQLVDCLILFTQGF